MSKAQAPQQIECDRWNWVQLLASENGPEEPATRHVLHVLALNMSQEGDSCFPSQVTIAQRTGLSVRSVVTHLAKAERDGWIRRFTKPRKSGHAYFIHEYVATIPDALADHAKPRPWEEDPTWVRTSKPKSKQSANSARSSVAQEAQQHANGAEQGAILAELGAISAQQGERIASNRVKGLHTNLPSESSSNYSLMTHRNVLQQAAGPGVGGILSKKSQQQELEELDAKYARILKAIAELPTYTNAEIAKLTRSTAADVKALRRGGTH